MNLKDMKIGQTIIISSLNPDEQSMLHHLSNSQVEMVLKDKHPIQRLGEIFDEETLDTLGIDPNASFELENILEELKKEKHIPTELDNKKTAEEMHRIIKGLRFEIQELEFQANNILKKSEDMQAVSNAYEAMERPLYELDKHLKEFRKLQSV